MSRWYFVTCSFSLNEVYRPWCSIIAFNMKLQEKYFSSRTYIFKFRFINLYIFHNQNHCSKFRQGRHLENTLYFLQTSFKCSFMHLYKSNIQLRAFSRSNSFQLSEKTFHFSKAGPFCRQEITFKICMVINDTVLFRLWSSYLPTNICQCQLRTGILIHFGHLYFYVARWQ